MQLAIIPCGKKKIWDKDPHKQGVTVDEAYIGVLHRLTKQYATLFCDQWVIMSAKHGFQLPYEIIPSNYNLTFGMKRSPFVITNQQLMKQWKEKDLIKYEQIIVLTGKKHKKVIDQLFLTDQEIIYPLLGTQGIGDMQKKLKLAIESKHPLH